MSVFRTAILEKVCLSEINILKAYSEVDDLTSLEYDEIMKSIHDYDAIIIKSVTQINLNFLEKAKKLKLIGRVGIGVDHIDLSEVKKRSIKLITTPGGNAIATAEFTVLAMLSIYKRFIVANQMVNACDFSRDLLIGAELFNKTIGIVGLGHVGIEVARRLHAFGCRLVACTGNSGVNAEEFKDSLGGLVLNSIEELVSVSDVVTIHASLTKDTEGLFNEAVFSRMKKGCFLINTARGKIIDDVALLNALDDNTVSFAVLDLLYPEMPYKNVMLMRQYENRLLEHKRVIVTPHMAALTVESQTQMMRDVMEEFIEFIKNISINSLGAVHA